jgi:pSer/pThr/pTyr-binding forkhead associated (FHA) protein
VASRGAPTGQWPSTPEQLGKGDAPGDPRQAAAKLTVKRANLPDVEIPLEKPEFYIGRQTAEVDLTLDDELVSRKHARLSVDARGYFRLDDLGSRNGIAYAGRVVRRLNLIDGDTFSIGKTDFVFHANMGRFHKKAEPPPRTGSVAQDVSIPMPEAEVSVSEVADSPLSGGAAARGLPEGE